MRRRELPRLGSKDALREAFLRTSFPERASFELRDDDVEALRQQFKNGALHWHAQKEAEEMAFWKVEHPCLLTHLPQFFELAKGKRVTVFMDYDGTLTPIVKDPDRAFMSDQMRDAVRAVARLFPTAIISGRGREKVAGFVKLKELFYAGSHGMDIIGPTLADSGEEDVLSFQAAAKFEPVMDRVYDDLVARTQQIPGASVEHNKFCVSVHFRNCEPDSLEEVVAAVEAVLASDKELKATRGRKVLEIRPEVEWNKGHALAHLLSSLDLGDTADVVPIYVGDDRTDEDAFAVLNQRQNGVGILVSTKVKPTEAVYTLRDPVEVMSFLDNLVAWGRTEDNAWHKARSCNGWRLNTEVAPAHATAATQLFRGDSGGCASEMSDTGDDEPHAMGRQTSSGRPPRCPPERSRLSHRGSLDSGSRSPTWPSNPGSLPPANGPSLDHQNGVTAALDPIRGAMRAQPPPVSPFQQAPSWSAGPSQEMPEDALSTAVTLGSENGTAARSVQSLDSSTLAAADSVPQSGEGHPSLASDSSEFLSATSSQ